MKIEELRIGNFIYGYSGKICIVNEILDAETINVKFGLPKGNDFWNECTPIPLTKEWLVKFGFTYHESNNSYQLDTEMGFSIWGRISEGFDTSTNNAATSNSEFGVTMKFVHEIQNRYFALTGQKLPLKK